MLGGQVDEAKLDHPGRRIRHERVALRHVLLHESTHDGPSVRLLEGDARLDHVRWKPALSGWRSTQRERRRPVLEDADVEHGLPFLAADGIDRRRHDAW